MNRATTFIGEVFRGLQVQGSINVHDESSEKHKSFSSYLKQRSKVNEIAIAGDVLLILEERGLCIAYDVGMSYASFNSALGIINFHHSF
tara:strand:+ start:276 stop:542 length:267 start_codon:yes stop_codon:yes gene_type:complete